MTNLPFDDSMENYTILNVLQDLGLTENESKVYKILLENGEMATQDILRVVQIRQPNLYDVISSLERKGFLNILSGRPKRYQAMDPNSIIEAKEQALKKGREYFLKWATKVSGNRKENTAIINSPNLRNIINNCTQIINQAKNIIEIETNLELLKYLEEPLLNKSSDGVRVSLLLFSGHTFDLVKDSDILKYVHDVRYIRPGQFFAVISDEKTSVFMPRNVALMEGPNKYGYVAQDRDMTWFITHIYFNEWYGAQTLKEYDPVPPLTYSSQRILVSDLKNILPRHKAVYGELIGFERESNKEVKMNGEIINVNFDSKVIYFTFTTGGKKYTVGGYDSQIEDIVMKSFTMKELVKF